MISKANNLNDTYQQWKVVRHQNSNRLQNVASGRYLRYDSTDGLSTVNNIGDSTAVTLSGTMIQIGGRYLILSGTTISTTQHSYNGTVLTITWQSQTTEKPGVAYTVTNEPAEYILPETGGAGMETLTFGGLLILAAALMYITIPGMMKKRGAKR